MGKKRRALPGPTSPASLEPDLLYFQRPRAPVLDGDEALFYTLVASPGCASGPAASDLGTFTSLR